MHVFAVSCFSDNHQEFKRVKRSDSDPTFFQKVKSGIKSAGSSVADFFETGYEEVKNVFSSDRNYGDFTIKKIDVRFGEEDDESADLTKQIEDHEKVHIETSTEIDLNRPKRQLPDSPDSQAADLRENENSDDTKIDIPVLSTTTSKYFIFNSLV